MTNSGRFISVVEEACSSLCSIFADIEEGGRWRSSIDPSTTAIDYCIKLLSHLALADKNLSAGEHSLLDAFMEKTVPFSERKRLAEMTTKHYPDFLMRSRFS